MDPLRSNLRASELYDRFYFSKSVGEVPYGRRAEWLNFFGHMADCIVADIAPRTVLDAGCAFGILVESLRDRGVEAFGIDVSDYALANVRDDIKPYVSQGSVSDPVPHKYDLVICIEVLEHLQPEEAEAAVTNLCEPTDDVIFASTPLDYAEVTHFNVQQPDYWALLFARNGFFRDVDYEPSTYIAPWAARYRRSHDPMPRIVANYERVAWRLRNENYSLRRRAVEDERRLASINDEFEAFRERHNEIEQGHRADMDSAAFRMAKNARRVAHRLMPLGSVRGRVLAWLLQPLHRSSRS